MRINLKLDDFIVAQLLSDYIPPHVYGLIMAQVWDIEAEFPDRIEGEAFVRYYLIPGGRSVTFKYREVDGWIEKPISLIIERDGQEPQEIKFIGANGVYVPEDFRPVIRFLQEEREE